jgi:hypothetical protein
MTAPMTDLILDDWMDLPIGRNKNSLFQEEIVVQTISHFINAARGLDLGLLNRLATSLLPDKMMPS